MPQVVQRFFSFAVDVVWPDVAIELKGAMQGAVLKTATPSPSPLDGDHEVEVGVGTSGMLSCCCCNNPLRWCRAFFLHHCFPHDKGTWTKLKDPFFVCFKVATLVPVFGVRIAFHALLLLALTLPANDMDEYQLCSYVLSFIGTQFLAGGLVMALQGGLSLFELTVYAGDGGGDSGSGGGGGSGGDGGGGLSGVERSLERRSPGVKEGLFLQLFDFLGAVVLGWLALALLPCSSKKGTKTTLVETQAQKRNREADQEARRKSCCGGNGSNGGHLRKLLKWDVACFGLCALLWVFLCAEAGLSVTDNDWRVASALFWCRIIYSMTVSVERKNTSSSSSSFSSPYLLVLWRRP